MGDVNSDLGFVLNQTPSPTQALPGLQEAQVLSADTTGIRVIIPAFHPDWAFGPARYSWPVTGYPPVGTGCLVTFTGDDLTAPWIVAWDTAPETPLELPGATALTRYVGGTALGPPTTGAFAKGDFVVAQDGTTWICTQGGGPGTWKANYQGAALPSATAATRYAGATATGAPAAGTFAVGDFVIDQTGLIWFCTVAGTPGTWRSSQDKPTGDIEPCLAIKPNQLLMQGQTISRTTYARLFSWATNKGLVGTAAGQCFGPGDGSTTFVLPDLRGRMPVGVGALGSDAYTLGLTGGATLKTLLAANLPPHDHKVTVADHGNHNHDLTGGTGGTTSDSGHSGHFPGTVAYAAPQANAIGAAAWNSAGNYNTVHTHNVQVSVYAVAASAGSHTLGQTALPAATAFDARPAFFALNWAIWT